MCENTQVVLDVNIADLSERAAEATPIGHATATEMVIAEDGWPRVKVICEFDVPSAIERGLRDGTLGVGFDAKTSRHNCNGDKVHTMIGGFESLNALAIVPMIAEMVKGGLIDEPPRLQ